MRKEDGHLWRPSRREPEGCSGGDSGWVPRLRAALQPLLRRGQLRKRGLGPRGEEPRCICRRMKLQVEVVRDAPGLSLPGNIRVEDAFPSWAIQAVSESGEPAECSGRRAGPVLNGAGPGGIPWTPWTLSNHAGAEGGVMWSGPSTWRGPAGGRRAGGRMTRRWEGRIVRRSLGVCHEG